MDTLQLTAAAIIENAADYHKGTITFDVFNNRARMLWDSVHRSDHEALSAILAEKGYKP